MFPLITNGEALSLPQILEAHRLQPKLEKRHGQLKLVQDLTPMWLKKRGPDRGALTPLLRGASGSGALGAGGPQGMAREKLGFCRSNPKSATAGYPAPSAS